ncbi:MAG: PEGA domain-containing protein [Candidatus Latescibacteria bacterium]|nr:PEGA domain-containing protein [Candidatus Latescibacterota bacterium]MCK5526069.1 PEGA domain-containing protein [Candidatus Latescibacterota bacterium]
MALSSEEEQRIREEIRSRLAQTLEAKQQKKTLQEQRRRERTSERDRQRIFEEEEHQFYEAQGLKKYINRHGGVEWLTREEIKKRRQSGKERYRIQKKKKRIRKWMAGGRILILVLIAGGLGGVLYKIRSMNVPEEKEPTTVVWVRSNVQGATIYVDERATGMMTDGVLKDLSEGKHNLAVALPEYVAIPDKQEIQVARGDTIEVRFELTPDYW